MEQSKNTSRRTVLLGVAVAAIVLIIIAVVAVVMMGTTKKDIVSTTKSASPTPTVATKSEVQQNMSTLDSTIKQAETDQAAAKAAITDSKSQIKVGN